MGIFGARKPRGENFLDKYPWRWWCPIVNIYGGVGHEEVYMRRFILTPKLPNGQLYLHIFYRADQDRDPHDHPFPFWTLPLNQGYYEEVYNTHLQCFTKLHVPRWKWSRRGARHTHRVVAGDKGRWPLVTLVWRGKTERVWGFWCHSKDRFEMAAAGNAIPNGEPIEHYLRKRAWVRWQDYTVNKGGVANVDGTDVSCPGSRA